MGRFQIYDGNNKMESDTKNLHVIIFLNPILNKIQTFFSISPI